MEKQAEQASRKASKEPRRKAYHRPEFFIYGDIGAVTQSSGKAGPMDNFKGFKTA